jgi:biofilm PGA synthesis N-glycosyltransferase PgaC
MKTLFILSMAIIFYTFIGYGILLFLIIKFKQLIYGKKIVQQVQSSNLPSCTVIVAAYNEEDFIAEKIANTLSLEYPADRIKYIFVTDGSSDGTPDIVKQYPEISLLHQSGRHGKTHAVHRAIRQVETDIMVFTDANTLLNKNALIEICKHYEDPLIGAVAGEKRIHIDEAADATAAEGFYWKYESKLKMWDSELYSVMGAAGELFSVRKELFELVPPGIVLDDFMISMRIVERGYRIAYEPKAYATETTSATIQDELKRKIRNAAGGIQLVLYFKNLFNVFKFPVVSFQYISHRVLRWTITPFLLILAFVLNMVIVMEGSSVFYSVLALLQVLFYTLAVMGWIMESKQVRIKLLFIPYYFCMMNYAVIAGLFRFFNSGQNVVWDKAERKLAKVTIG